MALPLLIAKEENRIIASDDYVLGWLFKDDNSGYWITWGSSDSKNNALSVAREVLEKQGEREVFISDTPLPKNLTKEHIEQLKPLKL